MRPQLLFAALLIGAAPVGAQPDPNLKPNNGLLFPLVAPEKVEDLVPLEPISLHLREVSLGAALRELQVQSGVELDLNVEADRQKLAKTLSVDIQTRSFNEAFAAVADEGRRADGFATLRSAFALESRF